MNTQNISHKEMVKMSFKEWMKENFNSEELKEIAQQGADIKWRKLTYHYDTVKLYDCYEEEMWETLAEIARIADCKSPVELLYRACKYARTAANLEQFKNAVVWLVAEYYAAVIARKSR